MTDDHRLQAWLRRLTWALATVPSPEREDIVTEARGHIEERVASGRSLTQTLDDFGAPEAYARQFVEEMETLGALGAQRISDLFGVVVRRAHRNLLASGALLVILAFGGLVLAMLAITAMKLIDPAHTGLWIGPGAHFIGVIDDPRTATDVLGLWLYPLAVFATLGLVLAGQKVLLWTVRLLSLRAGAF